MERKRNEAKTQGTSPEHIQMGGNHRREERKEKGENASAAIKSEKATAKLPETEDSRERVDFCVPALLLSLSELTFITALDSPSPVSKWVLRYRKVAVSGSWFFLSLKFFFNALVALYNHLIILIHENDSFSNNETTRLYGSIVS